MPFLTYWLIVCWKSRHLSKYWIEKHWKLFLAKYPMQTQSHSTTPNYKYTYNFSIYWYTYQMGERICTSFYAISGPSYIQYTVIGFVRHIAGWGWGMGRTAVFDTFSNPHLYAWWSSQNFKRYQLSKLVLLLFRCYHILLVDAGKTWKCGPIMHVQIDSNASYIKCSIALHSMTFAKFSDASRCT